MRTKFWGQNYMKGKWLFFRRFDQCAKLKKNDEKEEHVQKKQ